MAPVVPDQDTQPMHSNGVAMQSRKRSRVYYGRHREEIRARRSIQRYQHLQSPLNQTFPCHLHDSIDSLTPQPSMDAPPNPNEKIPPCQQSMNHIDFHFSSKYIDATHRFRTRIDALSQLKTCSTCKECYPGMNVCRSDGVVTCRRCFSETGIHRFSGANNMDPSEQPTVLRVLTQVEEMLIARVTPILQVTHAHGGQYKYSGHTISFPQDIQTITKYLPLTIDQLDVLMVRRLNISGKNYDCYVSRSHVHNALSYKIKFDPYYKDVEIDSLALSMLPTCSTDISQMLHTIDDCSEPLPLTTASVENIESDMEDASQYSTSFMMSLPNKRRQLQIIKDSLQMEQETDDIAVWPPIGSTPINEYTTEGLFDMAFPTLFPNGTALPMQPRAREVKIHEYAVHLIHYHDNRFGQHPRFRYFILNLMMRHRSQSTASVFYKRKVEDNTPSTVEDLRSHLTSLPDNQLAEELMHFGSSLRGTRAFWNTRRMELTSLITQIGSPTFFFTLSAADTKWSDLHSVLSPHVPSSMLTNKQRIDNVINNPHTTSLYLHQRFKIFREEVIEKLMEATNYWYRSEWQGRGSAHVHGVIWIRNAPNMDTLDWDNLEAVEKAKQFFEKYVSAMNPRSKVDISNFQHRVPTEDPCLLNTTEITNTDPLVDYEELVNRVQRHTRCTERTCLRVKGKELTCRYKAPWKECEHASLYRNETGHKCFEPARNDDRLNIHNPPMLSIWRANIDCQPITSRALVLKYIAKYASKSERKSENCVQMLARICSDSNVDDNAIKAYQKFMAEIVAERDISAQETCHMLQKLPLVNCNRLFMSLNVGRKTLHRLLQTSAGNRIESSYIQAYMERPTELQQLTLIESARSYTYAASRKRDKWRIRKEVAIVQVYPKYFAIPNEDSEHFETFCWTELLLYKHFRDIHVDIGVNKDDIIRHWKQLKIEKYNVWHVDRTDHDDEILEKENDSDDDMDIQDSMQLNEWEFLSQLGLANSSSLDDIDMLGKRDFDNNHPWEDHNVPLNLHDHAIQFIHRQKNVGSVVSPSTFVSANSYTLSQHQQIALSIIRNHSASNFSMEPLYMVIQGTAGTGKSYLISCIRNALHNSMSNRINPLLVLAPTGIAAFNIHASTIHAALKIPIREMKSLQGQALTKYQEDMKNIQYILIDEMSFIGPKLLLKIDSRLREAIPQKQHLFFGGMSLILVGDLAQLPPVMDKPLYASHTNAKQLWRRFNIVVTLETIFRQEGDDPLQIQFRRALHNIRNAEPMLHDWDLLMTRTNRNLTPDEQIEFDHETHLFATNERVSLHNKKMIKKLNVPIALCTATNTHSRFEETIDDGQLPKEVLLCKHQRVMLITNLWVAAGLVNGSLGEVKDIVYPIECRPPFLPSYVTVEFNTYTGPPWDPRNPKIVPIEPISRGNRTQIPLATAWAITIHKSQGLTLGMATIDIGKTERQGLTFTTISRVKSIQGLRIEPSFSFERFCKMKKNAYNILRKKEEARLHSISNQNHGFEATSTEND